jgi:hypothetical protein
MIFIHGPIRFKVAQAIGQGRIVAIKLTALLDTGRLVGGTVAASASVIKGTRGLIFIPFVALVAGGFQVKVRVHDGRVGID